MKKKVVSPLALIAATICLVFLPAMGSIASAGDANSQQNVIKVEPDTDADMDEALKAVRRGEALPLSQLQDKVTSNFNGDIINVAVKRQGKELRYEFKVLRPDGRVTEVELNATNGKIVEVEND